MFSFPYNTQRKIDEGLHRCVSVGTVVGMAILVGGRCEGGQ